MLAFRSAARQSGLHWRAACCSLGGTAGRFRRIGVCRPCARDVANMLWHGVGRFVDGRLEPALAPRQHHKQGDVISEACQQDTWRTLQSSMLTCELMATVCYCMASAFAYKQAQKKPDSAHVRPVSPAVDAGAARDRMLAKALWQRALVWRQPETACTSADRCGRSWLCPPMRHTEAALTIQKAKCDVCKCYNQVPTLIIRQKPKWSRAEQAHGRPGPRLRTERRRHSSAMTNAVKARNARSHSIWTLC